MQGHIHTIIGPMFSGKTSFLLHQLERLARSGKSTLLFTADTRSGDCLAHNGERVFEPIDVIRTNESKDLLEKGIKYQVIGVDEAQFFDEDLVDQLALLADCGKMVLVAGLDQDYKRDPFIDVLRLIAESERVTRLTAICSKCGSELAIRSVRKADSEERLAEGSDDAYAAFCRSCAYQLQRHLRGTKVDVNLDCNLARRTAKSVL